MRILVTGAGGLVGRLLLPRLQADGHETIGCDLEVDVADPAAIGALVEEVIPDAIVHLAAISATRNPADDPAEIFRINYGGVGCVLAAMRAHAPGARLLLVTSGLIYGTALAEGETFDESAPLRPRGAYGWSKAAGDRLAAYQAAEAGLDVVRVRPFNHTGPGRREDFVEAKLARQLAAIERGIQAPVVEAWNVEGTRDFLDVEDVIDAYAQLLSPEVPPGVYNVASGRGLRIREIFERLLAHSTVEAELVVPAEVQDPSDRSVGCADRLRAATGWAPKRDLDDTLGRLLESWRGVLASS
ncbi:MAG: NAD-dependent epimerase/dehydratase family protein [Deltaproteobacteria bacterium]|nr:NAD-dependent epimerase/dehydratase family protein [Deltaproteobacteria bacterium]MBW2396511.1 NAD-dependent epimerase/dehydratase family protein [Deltaproteobacteria bacterium]